MEKRNERIVNAAQWTYRVGVILMLCMATYAKIVLDDFETAVILLMTVIFVALDRLINAVLSVKNQLTINQWRKELTETVFTDQKAQP